MLDAFRAGYARDHDISVSEAEVRMAPPVPGLRAFFAEFGGGSFRGGLYRVVRPADLDVWQQRIALAFPEKAQAICFGYDWGGALFVLDPIRLEEGEPAVALLDPGAGEILKVPANLISFHERELFDPVGAALDPAFFAEWKASGGAAPSIDQCVGYKKPLFLGGADEVQNLQLADLDVYWHLTGQLISATKSLPEGTRVRRIKRE